MLNKNVSTFFNPTFRITEKSTLNKKTGIEDELNNLCNSHPVPLDYTSSEVLYKKGEINHKFY